jgi:hypothetical protein
LAASEVVLPISSQLTWYAVAVDMAEKQKIGAKKAKRQSKAINLCIRNPVMNIAPPESRPCARSTSLALIKLRR